MSLKSYLRTTYDSRVVDLTNSYGRCLEKIAKFRNHVVFTARCKKTGLIPPNLKINPPIKTDRGRAIADRASRQFLDERLRVANYGLRRLEDEKKWRELGLRRHLNTTDYQKVEKICKEQAEHTFVKVRERQREKFDRFTSRQRAVVMENQPKSNNTIEKTKWVINKSSRTLTEEESSILQRGFNFAQCQKTLPKVEIIAGVEPALRECPKEESAEHARSSIASILKHYQPRHTNTTTEERQAIRALKTDRNITVLAADKENATVVLDTSDYVEKAHALLNNAPFKRIAGNPTNRNERRVNDVLNRLAEKSKIDKTLQKALRVPINGTRPPLFYGSVKTHKDNFPLRPIVSAIGSATYNLSKYVSDLLTPYVRQAPSYIANTTEFLKEVNDISIADDEIMVSFDVKSLFTNVPRKDAMQAIREVITKDSDFSSRNHIDTGAFLELLNVCLKTTSFQFRESHYELTDGLPMGSPASPAIANIFMAKVEERALETFDTRPKIWHRYVDDIFSIVKAHLVDKLLEHLNAQHPSITFTVEREHDRQLPFMDARLERVEGVLKTGVYRKPTHTGRYLQFTSNHPNDAKRAVVRSLFRRLDYISLGEEEKQREVKQIHDELAANGYPITFVRKTVDKLRKSKESREEVKNISDVRREGTACIPYVRGASEQIRRILARLGIQTVMKPTKWKWAIMNRAKDRLQPHETPGVVYALGCTDCSKVYIGETNRTAKQRTREHRCHTRTGHTELSAIAEHVHSVGHNMHWKAHIVTREGHTLKRKVKEALAIHRLGRAKAMNQDCGLELSKLWLDAIKQ